MANFSRSDLKRVYSWSADGGDNPKLKGEPDSSLLDRSEGYEVLYMIRKLMDVWRLTSVSDGQKIERMIHAAPKEIHSQEKIKTWIHSNWSSY